MNEEDNCIVTTEICSVLSERISRLKPSSVTVLTDTNTKAFCYPHFSSVLPAHELITVSPGENHKNLKGAEEIWTALTRLQVDRKGLLIISGGGVLGDMGGFCAATFKRGIEFILIPTTLLAQVDASVGGKLGIDFNDFKNHIGVFREPYCTIIDTVFLKSLPAAELRSGFAEIIKHCLIADRDMWEVILKKKYSEQDLNILVSHSVTIKRKITETDPSESGLRKILNFGHTIGHAIESAALQNGKPLLHGEAIAAGMICESFIAQKKNMISIPELSRISDYLISIYGHQSPQKNPDDLINLMLQDKKNEGKKILMALPDGIGSCKWDIETHPSDILDALDYYNKLNP
ncbi:MAG: 3-dehydroquinate synthase [Cyclobacteriaceae bacterium]